MIAHTASSAHDSHVSGLGTDTIDVAMSRFASSLKSLETVDHRNLSDRALANASIEMLRLSRVLFPTSGYWESNSDDEKFERQASFLGGLVPLELANEVRLLEPLLRRSTLYARHTVFVLPQHVRYAGDRTYVAPAASLDALRLNRQLLPLVSAGRCSVLPQSLEVSLNNDTHNAFNRSTAPLDQPPDANYVPLNRARVTGTKEVLVMHHFLLPYYPEAEPKVLAKLATEETDAFELFMAWMTKKVGEAAANPETTDLADLVAEIDEGVAKLRITAENLARTSRLLRGASVGAFALSLGALAGPAPMQTAAGIVGGVNLIELVREEVSRRRQSLDLRASEFFVPYKLREG